MKKIKIAIVGVGNCASSLIQGIEYYRNNPTASGLIHQYIGGYQISDIEIVAAFDVDKRKVGKDVAEAIFAEPNCTIKFSDVPLSGVITKKGEVLDGVAQHMAISFEVDESQTADDVVDVLKESGVEILICYLPVGSFKAARYYAQAALDADVSFINAIPEFISSDEKWIKKFEERGLICAGDDIKSQIGATILHRSLTRLIQDRGHKITSTYQLNIGGNTDFLNMTDPERIISKRKSKTQAVTSILDDGESIPMKIGPSDYIPHLKDNKVCYINIKGEQFAGIPFDLELKLSVEDSPNSAGVMVDVIRLVSLAKDRGLSGYVKEINSYFFKSPKEQLTDNESKFALERFLMS